MRKVALVMATVVLTVLVVTVVQSSAPTLARGVTAAKVECFGFNASAVGDIARVFVYNDSNVEATYDFKFYTNSGAIHSSGSGASVNEGVVDTHSTAFVSGGSVERVRIKVTGGPPTLSVDAAVIHAPGTDAQMERQVFCQKA